VCFPAGRSGAGPSWGCRDRHFSSGDRCRLSVFGNRQNPDQSCAHRGLGIARQASCRTDSPLCEDMLCGRFRASKATSHGKCSQYNQCWVGLFRPGLGAAPLVRFARIRRAIVSRPANSAQNASFSAFCLVQVSNTSTRTKFDMRVAADPVGLKPGVRAESVSPFGVIGAMPSRESTVAPASSPLWRFGLDDHGSADVSESPAFTDHIGSLPGHRVINGFSCRANYHGGAFQIFS